MRALTRLAEPAVLAANGAAWSAAFLAKVGAALAAQAKPPRPPHAQYRHRDIVVVLRAMSFGKCFYCEQPLAEHEEEVDHHIEVAEDPARAFAWGNLYLACRGCNKLKLPDGTIPAADCLDPCAPGVCPHEHLTFDSDAVRARDDSPRGHRTIQKYRLDRDDLNLRRARQLRRFDEAVNTILRRMNAEQRAAMTDTEKEILRSFAQQEHPFSLMFAVRLAAEGL